MNEMEGGTPLGSGMPQQERGLNLHSSNSNYSTKNTARKPFSQTLSGRFNLSEVANQLQRYLDLGLIPIPLKINKKPRVHWKQWNPTTMNQLKNYLRPSVNWGVKTGASLSVIDFDTTQGFIDFIVMNIDKLPKDTPIIRTGRGYHIWFKPKETIRNQYFEGIDIKGEGGYIVAPPSIHANGNPYRFIKPLNNTIPELELDGLDFSRQKPGREKGNVTHTHSAGPIAEQALDLESIMDGVKVGQRHMSLVRYVGRLIAVGLTKDEITTLAFDWNVKNKPPMSADEVRLTVDDCYARYAKNVPTKTLNQIDSVLIEATDFFQSIPLEDHKLSSLPRLAEVIKGDRVSKQSPWETEVQHSPTETCSHKRRIVRKGRHYISVSFFCGRWDCLRCSSYFRKRWISHLVEVTQTQPIFKMYCKSEDWGKVRRRINRGRAEYVKIVNDDSNLVIILNKPLKGTEPLSTEELEEFLQAAIPHQYPDCPVSTSRGWERQKKTKTESKYKIVKHSRLPLSDQMETATELGATSNHYGQWDSPEEVDEEEWEAQFKEKLTTLERKVDQEIEKGNSYLMKLMEIKYREDANWEELEREELCHGKVTELAT